jgi:hypothetical protein
MRTRSAYAASVPTARCPRTSARSCLILILFGSTLFVCLNGCLFVWLFGCLFGCLFVCLFVCLLATASCKPLRGWRGIGVDGAAYAASVVVAR